VKGRRVGGAGATLGINAYGEYGIPNPGSDALTGTGNVGRFQYTGQAWLAELGMYYYKARIYSPTLGRFLQTDPIGYADGLNWYNYVGGDPVNATDPSGLCGRWGRYLDENGVEQSEWIVLKCPGEGGGGGYFLGLFRSGPVDDSGALGGSGGAGAPQNGDAQEIVVTAYWRKQQAAGNPIARLGLQFCYGCAADWSTAFARQSLIAAIAHQPINGRYPSAAQVRARYGQIRVALMNADQAARLADTSGVRGLLSAGQIYNYHVSVYASFGLSSYTFGGSYFTGSRSEAIASSWYWCASCDR